MNTASKLLGELRRMLTERLTLLVIMLNAVGAVWFSLNGTGRTASDAFMIIPAQSSAFLGAFLFSLLSLAQMHRDYKNNTDAVVLTCTDPLMHQVRRTLALIGAAVVTMLLVTLFALPFGIAKTGVYFQPATFLTAWFIIYLGALVFAVLLSSGLYMLTRRVEAAFVIMAGLILLSNRLETMFVQNPNYLLYWVQTTAGSFSDVITNRFHIRMLLWNRLFGMLVSLGVWALGLCSLRRYGRGVLGSFSANSRRVWTPLLLTAALLLSGASYVYEPIFDDSKPIDLQKMMGAGAGGAGAATFSISSPEVGNPKLTLTDKSFKLDINGKRGSLSGTASWKVENADTAPQTLPLQLNTGIHIDSVMINGKKSKAVRGETGTGSEANWSVELPVGQTYEIEIAYSGRVRNDNSMLQKVTFGIADGYVSLPSLGVSPILDIQVAPTLALSGTILLDDSLDPVFPSGKAVRSPSKEGKSRWQYEGAAGKQGTSLFAAEYMTRSFEAGGLPIDFKYFKKHDQSITDMDAVHVMKAAIDYFTETYGPLVFRGKLTMLELPSYYRGGFAGGSMSAMDETSFNAEGYLSPESLTPDSGGGIDVLIHEIAHQWWGLGSMPVPDGVSNWSPEGITCYSTYSFMKQHFGEEYAKERFVKAWQHGWDRYTNAFYVQNPEYLEKLSAKNISIITGEFASMKQYDIMPLMMLQGETALGGAGVFQKKLSELYKTHMMKPVTYQDFLTATGLTEEAMELE